MKKASGQKRPSMQDVADLAGVSRTTVSFVLNKKPDSNIPPETQEKVWAAVDQLNYRPNAIARGLRAQRTHTIGFISDRVMTTPFAGQMLLGAQDLAWEHNMLLLAVNTGDDQEIKKAAVDMLLDRQVDGIIYASWYHRQVNVPPNTLTTPTVLIDCFDRDRTFPSVVPDEEVAGFTATKLLLEKGHRRVAHISDIDPVPAQISRLAGYKRALQAFDIPYDPDLVVRAEGMQGGGFNGMRALLDLPQRPTAVFCFNDRMAMGAYDALNNDGLSIPDDMAVVGFDNHEIIAAHLHPSLTTMQLPHYEMGQWGVKKLLEIIESDTPAEPVQEKIICEPVIRDSI